MLSAPCLLPELVTHSLCPVRYFLGIPCPFCGLTRGVGQALQLNWHQATAFHMLSIPVAAFFLLRMLYLGAACADLTPGLSWRAEQTVDGTFDKTFLVATGVVYVFKFLLRR
jgi:hypothetical protein